MSDAIILVAMMTDFRFPSRSDMDPHPKVIITRIIDGRENMYPAEANLPLISYAYMGRKAKSIPWVVESTSEEKRIFR